jgi:hypothetical protein
LVRSGAFFLRLGACVRRWGPRRSGRWWAAAEAASLGSAQPRDEAWGWWGVFGVGRGVVGVDAARTGPGCIWIVHGLLGGWDWLRNLLGCSAADGCCVFLINVRLAPA